jgi:hypothetical protein
MGTLHQDGIGRPDGLERLWTPYRMAYIRGESKPADDTEGECPFCRIAADADDEKYLVVHRRASALAVLAWRNTSMPDLPDHLNAVRRCHRLTPACRTLRSGRRGRLGRP